MFNKLKGSIKKIINYTGRATADLLVDEIFLSVRTELILSAVLLIQIILVITFFKNLVFEISSFTTLRQARVLAEKRLSQIQNSLLQVKKMPQAAENLLESLPGSKGNYNLLEALNASAGTNQVSLLSVNFLPTKNSGLPGLTEQPVEIRLQGNYENIFSFIVDMEKNKRPVLTESIEYSTNNKVSTVGVVEAAVVIKTFLVDVSQ